MTLAGRKEGKQVNFWISAKPGSQVSVAGTFNNWNPTANPMQDQAGRGYYKTDMFVAQGLHEYKFIINGAWSADPSCPSRVPDSFGSENSVLQISQVESKVSEPVHSGKIPKKVKKSKDVELCRKN